MDDKLKPVPETSAISHVSDMDRAIEIARPLVERAVAYAHQSRASNTSKAYKSDWGVFERWCLENDLPAEQANDVVVAAYLSARADEGAKYSTIQRAYSGITNRLRTVNPKDWASGHRPATIEEVLKGIANTIGTAQDAKKPLTLKQITELLENHPYPDTLRGNRDRAAVLLTFWGAFRRSEACYLERKDVKLTDKGLQVTLDFSKTDQSGEGIIKGILFQPEYQVCAVRALSRWVKMAGIKDGYLFRAMDVNDNLLEKPLPPRILNYIVKKAAQKLGLNPDQFGAHSLRAGFVTTAALSGETEEAISRQTGHKSREQLSRYIRRASVFQINATRNLSNKV